MLYFGVVIHLFVFVIVLFIVVIIFSSVEIFIDSFGLVYVIIISI